MIQYLVRVGEVWVDDKPSLVGGDNPWTIIHLTSRKEDAGRFDSLEYAKELAAVTNGIIYKEEVVKTITPYKE